LSYDLDLEFVFDKLNGVVFACDEGIRDVNLWGVEGVIENDGVLGHYHRILSDGLS
jgi:hypothetical protein